MHECIKSFRFRPRSTPCWDCRWNDRARQSIVLCSNLEYAQHLLRVTKLMSIVLLRQLHDNLRVAEHA